MKTLAQRVAVVTGAASGIGRALATRLHREGAHLALADVSAAGLDETARALSGGGRVTVHVVDVSRSADFETFAREVERVHGGANLLVNNAGVALHGTFDEISTADMEWLMGINFWGTVHGVRAFLPQLRAKDDAHIVNLSSIFGILAPPGQTAYCASKFAVRGFTESLRGELAGTSVRVSVVHPGGVRTNIAASARRGAAMDAALADKQLRWFEKQLRLPPDAAADRIVRGILRNEGRILVGSDAALLDRVQRWFPETYIGVLKKLAGRVPAK